MVASWTTGANLDRDASFVRSGSRDCFPVLNQLLTLPHLDLAHQQFDPNRDHLALLQDQLVRLELEVAPPDDQRLLARRERDVFPRVCVPEDDLGSLDRHFNVGIVDLDADRAVLGLSEKDNCRQQQDQRGASGAYKREAPASVFRTPKRM